jgi:hypothetical protein
VPSFRNHSTFSRSRSLSFLISISWTPAAARPFLPHSITPLFPNVRYSILVSYDVSCSLAVVCEDFPPFPSFSSFCPFDKRNPTNKALVLRTVIHWSLGLQTGIFVDRWAFLFSNSVIRCFIYRETHFHHEHRMVIHRVLFLLLAPFGSFRLQFSSFCDLSMCFFFFFSVDKTWANT